MKPLAGFISLKSRGGDGHTHSVREINTRKITNDDGAVVAIERVSVAHCGRADTRSLPVSIFMTYGNNPICRACVRAVEEGAVKK